MNKLRWCRCILTDLSLLWTQLREYKVIGRLLPSAKNPAPPLYRMRIFAPNHVVAKSRFWYFVSQLRKMKKASGETVYCGLVGLWTTQTSDLYSWSTLNRSVFILLLVDLETLLGLVLCKVTWSQRRFCFDDWKKIQHFTITMRETIQCGSPDRRFDHLVKIKTNFQLFVQSFTRLFSFSDWLT